MYIAGIVILMLILVVAFIIGACVAAGWADKEMERLIDFRENGGGVLYERCKELSEATEEVGDDDNQ